MTIQSDKVILKLESGDDTTIYNPEVVRFFKFLTVLADEADFDYAYPDEFSDNYYMFTKPDGATVFIFKFNEIIDDCLTVVYDDSKRIWKIDGIESVHFESLSYIDVARMVLIHKLFWRNISISNKRGKKWNW